MRSRWSCRRARVSVRGSDKVDHLVISQGELHREHGRGLCDLQERPPHPGRDRGPSGADAGGDRRLRRQSLATGAEFTYPLVRAEDMEAQFPGSQRTYVKVAGGAVTGGNMTVMSPRSLPGIARSASGCSTPASRRSRWRGSSGFLSSLSTSQAGFASMTSNARWESFSARSARRYTRPMRRSGPTSTSRSMWSWRNGYSIGVRRALVGNDGVVGQREGALWRSGDRCSDNRGSPCRSPR